MGSSGGFVIERKTEMGRRKGSATKEKRRKRVTVKLIPRKNAGEVTEPWSLMEEIKAKEHANLEGAKIAMAWRIGWRSDADGIMTLGMCRKRGDLDRELDSFDFVILLNQEAWKGLNTAQKRALIDHELCHAKIVVDSDGNPKTDDRDRLVCRIRKHDCEEFKSVVERHGLWTSDLAALAQATINDAARPLLAESEKKDATVVRGDKWKSLSLAAAAISDKYVEKLESAGVHTLGELQEKMNKHGQFWAKELGLARQRVAIEDEFNRYLMEITPKTAEEKPAEAKAS
jgi:hypothetical protein